MVDGIFGHYKFIILYLFGAWILVFQIYLCPGFPRGGGNDNRDYVILDLIEDPGYQGKDYCLHNYYFN